MARIAAKLRSAVSRQGGYLLKIAIRDLRETGQVKPTSLVDHGLVLNVLRVDGEAGRLVSAVERAQIPHSQTLGY